MFKVNNTGRKIKNKKSVVSNKIGYIPKKKIKSHWDIQQIDKVKKMKIKKPNEIFEDYKPTKK